MSVGNLVKSQKKINETPAEARLSRLGFETKRTKTLGLAPILIIDKSRSRTHLCVYLSRSLEPGLVLYYLKSENFVKVLSFSCLGLETKGTRLSVLSPSRSTFDL